MTPNTRHSLCLIHHFVHNYMHNLKTNTCISVFYLLNNCCTIGDMYSLGYSCMRDAISKLWLQTHTAISCQYKTLCILRCITGKLQVMFGRSTYRTIALLLEKAIFDVRAICKIRLLSYGSKHVSQSIYDNRFLCMLTCIT